MSDLLFGGGGDASCGNNNNVLRNLSKTVLDRDNSLARDAAAISLQHGNAVGSGVGAIGMGSLHRDVDRNARVHAQKFMDSAFSNDIQRINGVMHGEMMGQPPLPLPPMGMGMGMDQHQPTLMPRYQQHQRQHAFEMSSLHETLPVPLPIHERHPPTSDWSADFVKENRPIQAIPTTKPAVSLQQRMPQYYAHHYETPLPLSSSLMPSGPPPQPSSTQSQLIPPELSSAFDKAFDHVSKHLAAQSSSIHTSVRDAAERLANTVETVKQDLESTTSSKLNESKFMAFVNNLATGQSNIEGDKVVENVAARGQTATNAPGNNNDPNATLSPSTGERVWSEEYSRYEEYEWANVFQGNGESYSRDPMQRHYHERHEQQQDSRNQEQQKDSIEQPQNEEEEIDPDLEDMDKLYRQYNEEFRRHHDHLFQTVEANAQQRQKKQDTDEMDRLRKWSLAPSLDNPRYSQYTFSKTNPFASVNNNTKLTGLAESILALEAMVMREPSNSKAWYELGIRQQENENEAQAIAALRECLRLDATGSIQAYLALATSYANEGLAEGVYDVLTKWIEHHPTYSGLVAHGSRGIELLDQEHDGLVRLLMESAKLSPGSDLDPDVQTALGILFNVSGEYHKAIDCFEAALHVRPNDYMLWNKLGATLANQKQNEKAIDAYYNALDIHPNFIRARYNAAIACLAMGLYPEAAEHLVHALAIQEEGQKLNAKLGNAQTDGGKSMNSVTVLESSSSVVSNSVWNTLHMVLDSFMHRDDLREMCVKGDLEGLKSAFDM